MLKNWKLFLQNQKQDKDVTITTPLLKILAEAIRQEKKFKELYIEKKKSHYHSLQMI